MAQKALNKIVAELEKCCQSQQTGTLRILGNNHFSATLVLDKGRIVAIQCGACEGQQALEKIAAIQTGFAKFIEGFVEPVNAPPLPANEVICQRLLGQEPAAIMTATIHNPSHKPLTTHHQTLLEELLADQIGPMAQIICDGVFSTVADTETAIAVLAQKIPEPDLREQFLAAVQAKL